MGEILTAAATFFPLVLTILSAAVVLLVADRVLIKRAKLNSQNRPPHQLVMIVLSLLAAVAVILSIPVGLEVKKELLGLLGIVLTGIIAFSSTTFVANMMAGLMLRSVKSFSPGDFIEAGQHFGKVTERGLFHTEIQSEDRDLITLPNLYLASNPVKVIRSSGTALNCYISLGYDVPHRKVEELLKSAAEKAELRDPFVQIETLGDFAITYKAVGFYENIEHLLSTKSAFKAAVLDALHGSNVEIVSPAFMNQRVLQEGQRFVPEPANVEDAVSATQIFPESLLFDKANRAKRIEMLEEKRMSLKNEIRSLQAESGRDTVVAHLQSQLRISEILLDREKEKEDE